MELILPGLFIFFVVFPLLFLWLAFRLAGGAQRLAKRQQQAFYPTKQVLAQTHQADKGDA